MKEWILNQRGATLWLIMTYFIVIIFLFASSIGMLLQHRHILKLREGQIQANQMIQNGIAFVKSLCLETEIIQNQFTLLYPNGEVRIEILGTEDESLSAKITAITKNLDRQTYRVAVERTTQETIQYIKIGG